MNEVTTPPPTEAATLSKLTDLALMPPAQREQPVVRREQLRQAWKEYLEAEKDSDELRID